MFSFRPGQRTIHNLAYSSRTPYRLFRAHLEWHTWWPEKEVVRMATCIFQSARRFVILATRGQRHFISGRVLQICRSVSATNLLHRPEDLLMHYGRTLASFAANP